MAMTKLGHLENINISSTNYKDMAQTDGTAFNDFYSIPQLNTDGTSGVGETTYIAEWRKWHGYYRKIPEFQAVVDKMGNWTVGKGYTASSKTMKTLNKITGIGKDDFNSIIENMLRTALICGDSYTEIIRDKAGRLINLKALSPASIQIIVDERGLIKRYEQVAQIGKTQKAIRFNKKEIMHLSWNRIADEVHGIPFAEKAERLMLMRNEVMEDMKVLFHRYVKPVTIIPVDEDDETELSKVQEKYKNSYAKAEPMLVPKDTFDVKNMRNISLPDAATLDPLPWLKYLIRVFSTSLGMPEVIMGWGADTTEASSKITYLAFQQTIERMQRWMEQQLKSQTGIEIKLEFPASIEPEMTEGNEGQGSSAVRVKKITEDNKKDSPINSQKRSEIVA
jgi:endonuclease III-like uncharacterized protein